MNGTKFNMVSEANGAVVISNDDSRITIHPDGTIAISSYAPVQLTGACAAKLDNAALDGAQVERVTRALATRLPKKSSN
jgi:hypothetical protein